MVDEVVAMLDDGASLNLTVPDLERWAIVALELVQKQTPYAGYPKRILASAKVFRRMMAIRQELWGETLVDCEVGRSRCHAE